MNLLLLFIDGIGLGPNNPNSNPFAKANMPYLKGMLGGRALTTEALPLKNDDVTLLAVDACLGVEGMPQSATGQATLLTGCNVPAQIGYHYGPKPNQIIADIVTKHNIFTEIIQNGKKAAFLNAYPPQYFEAIQSGRRIYATIPLGAVSAGLPLKTLDDLQDGSALSADFTAEGWRDHLKIPDIEVLSPLNAGQHLCKLAGKFDFALFEYWLSDYAGHNQDMAYACHLLEVIDQVLAGLVQDWNGDHGLILITSDHGNMEDLSTRRHTTNPIPVLLFGSKHLRSRLTSFELRDLSNITPAIVHFLRMNSD